MKNTHYILFVLSLFLGFSSCHYLDIEPIGQVIPHKTTEYRDLLTEGYFQFPSNDSKAYVGVISDEVKTLTTYLTSNYSTELPKNLVWQYTNDMFEYPYTKFYTAIFQANAVISGIMDAEHNAKEPAEQILGEAYALRAYSHFCLVNLYGKPYATATTDKGIPIASTIDIDQKFFPASVAEVYKFILSDIENAEKLMTVEKQENVQLNYRFSLNALQAFKARVMLYMGRWQEAYDEATSVLSKYTLVNLNKITNNMYPWVAGSPEAILALERPFSGANGDLRSAAVISDEIYAYFSTNDARTTYFIFDSRPKYGYKLKERYASDRISIHASEMYLIAAEAAAHLDNMLDKAKEYLNSLQAMRFKTNFIANQKAKIDAMDKDAIIREIAEERARELIGEGHRWFDLRRTTRPAITKTYDEITYTLEKDDPRYTLPFPKEAVMNNPNLNN